MKKKIFNFTFFCLATTPYFRKDTITLCPLVVCHSKYSAYKNMQSNQTIQQYLLSATTKCKISTSHHGGQTQYTGNPV